MYARVRLLDNLVVCDQNSNDTLGGQTWWAIKMSTLKPKHKKQNIGRIEM